MDAMQRKTDDGVQPPGQGAGVRQQKHVNNKMIGVLRIGADVVYFTEGSHNGKRVVLIDAPPGVELGFVRKEKV